MRPDLTRSAKNDVCAAMNALTYARRTERDSAARTSDCPEDVLAAESRSVLRAYVSAFIAAHTSFFAERVRSGRIRDGHGDLHANSVCVQRRKIYLFDCIEFSS